MKSYLAAACVSLLAWTMPSAGDDRQYNAEELAVGKQLFQSKCAACHGSNGEGLTQNWQQRDANGKFPPPPLNGTAHTWHHPVKALFRTVKEGTIPLGGSMPGWGGKLSDSEILLVIDWITSLWPDEIYEMWSQRN